MATDIYFPSLGKTLLDDPVDETKIFNLMIQVYLDCLFGKEVFYAKKCEYLIKRSYIISGRI
jgi:hypothetical protein